MPNGVKVAEGGPLIFRHKILCTCHLPVCCLARSTELRQISFQNVSSFLILVHCDVAMLHYSSIGTCVNCFDWRVTPPIDSNRWVFGKGPRVAHLLTTCFNSVFELDKYPDGRWLAGLVQTGYFLSIRLSRYLSLPYASPLHYPHRQYFYHRYYNYCTLALAHTKRTQPWVSITLGLRCVYFLDYLPDVS